MNRQTVAARKRWEWPEAKHFTSVVGDFDPPSHFAEAMAQTIPIKPGKTRLLDVGCGCGIIGIFCLTQRKARFVTFNDIQSNAIATTFVNVDIHIQRGNIREKEVACLKAAFAEIPPAVVAKHDLIAFNPPQLPWKYITEEYREDIKANAYQRGFRDGGRDGLRVVRQFLKWYRGLKTPRPIAVVVLSSVLGKSRIQAALDGNKLNWKVLEKRRVPLRRILAHSAHKFSKTERDDRSLLKGDDGEWTKELLVISIGNPRKT
jgi:methylase of polypeptide subunit release factors